MTSDKETPVDSCFPLENRWRGDGEQYERLRHDADAVAGVRLAAYTRQAVLRHHAKELMPDAAVDEAFAAFIVRMASKKRTRRLSVTLLWTISGVAACLLILFGVLWWTDTEKAADTPDIAYDVPRTKLHSPSIVTDKGKVIPLSGQSQNLSASATNQSARSRLLRALGLTEDEVSTEKCSLAVPPGKSYDIVLADGTRVWLYADSKLTYPLSFKGKERAVYLQGQAEFEVTHDAAHPFVIITDKLDARVLGTELNVSCYPDEPPHVALLHGVVVVSGRKGDREVRLRPGQGATLRETGGFDVADEDMDTYEYWKNGYLYFDGQPLGTIARSLERWYRVSFIFDDPAIAQKRLRFFCMRSDNLGRALELLNHYCTFEAVHRADGVHIK